MCSKSVNVKMIGVLAVSLVFFMMVGVAEEEKTDVGGQWKYVLEDGGAAITGYAEEPSGDLVIPGELDGYLVIGIGDRAFKGCDNINSVTIPGSISVIGRSAFYECKNLTTAIILDGVQSISGGAFSLCPQLTTVVIPKSVTQFAPDGSTGYYASERAVFYDCPKLTLVLEEGSAAEAYAYRHGSTFVNGQYCIPHVYGTIESIQDYAASTGVDAIRTGIFPGMFTGGWEPFAATLNQKMATRTGPGTKFTETHGTLSQDTEIVAYLQETGGSTIWVLVEYKRNDGKLVRTYTGAKRVDADYEAMPYATKEPQSAVVIKDSIAYYGPGKAYKDLNQEVEQGTDVLVYGTDMGYALIEYTEGDAWVRSWVSMDAIAFQ